MECTQCGSDDIVLDEKQGYMVCDTCGTVAQEGVAAEDYASNRNYNVEHIAPAVDEALTYQIVRVNNKLQELEVKSKRTGVIRDLITRFQQEDCHEFPPDVLKCTEGYVDTIDGHGYTRGRKGITLLHILCALLFLAHEACNKPVTLLQLKKLFDFPAITPVSRHVAVLRQKVGGARTSTSMAETFEYKVSAMLLKAADAAAANKPGARPVRRDSGHTAWVLGRAKKIMLMWTTLEAAAEVRLMMHLQSDPKPCVQLFEYFQRKTAKSKCRKGCQELLAALTRLHFDFDTLTDVYARLDGLQALVEANALMGNSRQATVKGLDYVLSSLIPSEDVVEVAIGNDSDSQVRKTAIQIQELNSYMTWMKRSDEGLYNDIMRRYS